MQKFLLILFLHVCMRAGAQGGRVTGTIVDAQSGETLPGAIALIEGTSKAGQADFEGRFSISNISEGKVTLVISYISYTTKKITDIVIKNGETVDVNARLDPAGTNTLEGVEVVVTLNRETPAALLLEQKNNGSVSDGVSAETIRRTPDRTTSDVFKRVSGASIQDSKFAIVRGLNDRYNSAWLNGAPLPSTESDRKAFSFDIFPSNMLDNLVITKTARPDMTGEFAGGIIDIRTKSIPEKNFIAVSAGAGYNSITTFKEQLYSRGGKTDWLGLDDGTRSMPEEMPAFHDFAVDIHQQAKYAREVPLADWNTYSQKFSPNQSFQLSGGANIKRKEKDFFGVTGSVTHNKTNNFFTTERYVYGAGKPNDSVDPIQTERHFFDNTYQTQILAGALLNMALKLNGNNSFASKNLLSINTDDRLIERNGRLNVTFEKKNPDLLRSKAVWYTQNTILSSQLTGDHYLPKSKLRLSWTGGLTKVKRDIPNLRRNVYTRKMYVDTIFPEDPSEPPIVHPKDTVWQAQLGDGKSSGPDYAGVFLFANLNEKIESFKGDLSRMFKVSSDLSVEGKTGGFYQRRDRTYEMRQFSYSKYGAPGGTVSFDDSLSYLSENELYTAQNMGLLKPGVGGLKLVESTQPQEAYYMAASYLTAGYGMIDVKYKTWLRLLGGVRYETYRQNLDYPHKLYYFNKEFVSSDTTFNDLLPSANIVFSPGEKQNFRVGYSRTINRPEFREIAPLIFYDFNTGYSLKGNPSLIRAQIDNYDLRYEIFPGGGQLVSVSAFMKEFTNPIELIQLLNVNEITYNNVPKATAKGLEFEYRINVGGFIRNDSAWWGRALDNLTLFSNLSLIQSKTDVLNLDGTKARTRSMQGQSPYIINGGLSYIDRKYDYSVSAMVNRVGPRIYVAGNYLLPEVWENARTVVDLQFTKGFFKNRLDIRFNIKDVLAKRQLQMFYLNFDDDIYYNPTNDARIWITQFGVQYSFVIGYRF